jgi:hypothetical protein
VAAQGPNRQAKSPQISPVAGAALNRLPRGLTQVEFEEKPAMRFRSALATLAVILSLTAAAHAEDCPAKSSGMDDIVAALNAAKGCDAAMKVFQACEYGASGDVQFGEVVEKKCEGDFLDRLKPPRKAAYQRELGACDRKYRDQSGTMYISFTAFCRAELAQRYSHQALKTAR